MHKIKLIIDDLKVDSFSTSSTEGRNGTVLAFMPPPSLYTCPEAGCQSGGCPSAAGCTADTSAETCAASCGGGCNLSADGGGAYTCALDCFSHYTDCHRCP